MLTEEALQLVERDQVHTIIQIYVPSVRHDVELLRLGGELVGILAELAGMSLVTRNEQHGTRRDRLDVVERVEVHELDVAGQGRMGGELRRLAFGSELTSGRAVEVIKLTLDGVRGGSDLMDGPACVLGLAARVLHPALFCCRSDGLLALFD